jgi:formate/nitrite transporter FocA (FNT family)
MTQTINPYAPPKARVEDIVPETGEAGAIRREHIKREAAIRSIGTLYYLGGGVLCLAAIGMIFGSVNNISRSLPAGIGGAIVIVIGGLSLFVARGLRQLRPWARTTTVVLSVIGLVRVPLGTLINAYILYLLLSQQGRRIFQSDYADIVAATPDIKYRSSVVTWVLLGILVLLLVGLTVFSLRR